jgi:GT2 family glycosyltransferase
MNTHVSVIVVNYNNAKFIKRCIFSLKKQSYKNLNL